MRLVENAYQSSKVEKQTKLMIEEAKSSNKVASADSVVDHAKATVNCSIDFSLKMLKIETSSCKHQTSLDGCYDGCKEERQCNQN